MSMTKKAKAFLLDMDGTFFLENHLLPGALEILKFFNESDIPFCFLTNNSSKSSQEYKTKLIAMGVDEGDARIFTSGDAAIRYLKEKTNYRKLFVVGTPGLETDFAENGFDLDENKPDALVMGFDTTLTYHKLEVLCAHVRAGLTFIATHPDINCPTPHGFIPDIGAMLALVKASTGRAPDLIVGKPNPMIVEMAAGMMGFQAKECCMVGDRLYTDIALGESAGVMTILMLTGETKREDIPRSKFQPDLIFENLKELKCWLEEG